MLTPQMQRQLTADYCINIKAKTTERAVLFTPQEIREKVGEEKSVLINFVPQMLTAMAIESAEEFADYCRDHRIEGTLKSTRIVRRAVEVYRKNLFRYYGTEASAAYEQYVKKFSDTIATDLWLLRLKLSELIANQFPKLEDRNIPILLTLTNGLIAYTEIYDQQMDRELERMLSKPVKCKNNVCLDVIKALFACTAEEKGCKVRIDQQATDWFNILGNKAVLLAKRIFAEEKEENVDKS